MRYLPSSWQYIHFTNEQQEEYILKNPLPTFDNMIDLYRSLNGAHKSDLFRFYYLYINGGVFIDSDAMLTTNITDVIKNYSFFSAISEPSNQLLLNGFMGIEKHHIISLTMLKSIYNINPSLLNDKNYYFVICNFLFHVVKRYNEPSIKLYNELKIDDNVTGVYNKKQLLLKHYWRNKIVEVKY